MDLQSFISQSLIQIANGISDADKQLGSVGAVVNPRHVNSAGQNMSNVYGFINETSDSQRAIHSIEFDVAVTAVEEKETKGGIGVAIGVIGLGSQGRSEESNTSISRIKFRVLIAFPNSEIKLDLPEEIGTSKVCTPG